MAKKMMYGVEGVAKAIPKAYWGVDGVARKIKKAYYGVGGVAKEIFTLEEGYLHNGTSTFTFTTGDLVQSMSGFTLSSGDGKVLVENMTAPVDIYVEGVLKMSINTSLLIEESIEGLADMIFQNGSVTIELRCAGRYDLGVVAVQQVWINSNDSKNTSTLYAQATLAELSDNVAGIKGSAVSGNMFANFSENGRLDIPAEGLITMGDYALQAMPVEFDIPRTVTSLGQSAAWGYIKDTLTIPRSVAQIGEIAFAIGSYSTIVFEHEPTDPLTIDPSAFKTKSTKNVTVYHKGHASVLEYGWAEYYDATLIEM